MSLISKRQATVITAASTLATTLLLAIGLIAIKQNFEKKPVVLPKKVLAKVETQQERVHAAESIVPSPLFGQEQFDYPQEQLLESRLLNAATTFSEVEYIQMYPDVSADLRTGRFASATAHYWKVGAAQGRNPSLLFDEAYYLDKNPDVKARVAQGEFASGFQHFQMYGNAEGRKYRPLFDEVGYLAMHPEIAQKVKSGSVRSGIAYYITNARRLNFDTNHVVAKN